MKEFILLVIVFIAACALLFFGAYSCRPVVEDYPTPSAVVAEIKQASAQVGAVKIQVVVIDGVEYLVAETYRGVGICRK